MKDTKTHIDQVIYNACAQQFEALVTVGTGDDAKKYACAIDAPITMTFKDAAQGLTTKALRMDKKHQGLRSFTRQHVAAVRAGRPRFDPRVWLSQLDVRAFIKAA
ncbi:orotidine 5-phosphate decarboxylase [Sulfitobacter sp. HNIBRBA2951]|uniref:orotidine 5-phosphate decarboxylase n=1 Tax=Sulfitobacter aquimarinus TaxID=3158557 RepID=UPI0032DF8313